MWITTDDDLAGLTTDDAGDEPITTEGSSGGDPFMSSAQIAALLGMPLAAYNALTAFEQGVVAWFVNVPPVAIIAPWAGPGGV